MNQFKTLTTLTFIFLTFLFVGCGSGSGSGAATSDNQDPTTNGNQDSPTTSSDNYAIDYTSRIWKSKLDIGFNDIRGVDVIMDVDNDGIKELLVANTNTFVGTNYSVVNGLTGQEMRDEMVHANSNWIQDLVKLSETKLALILDNYDLSIYSIDTKTYSTVVRLPNTTRDIYSIGDIDGDGKQDIAVKITDSSTNQPYLRLLSQDGSLDEEIRLADLPASITRIVSVTGLGDINGDNCSDLVILGPTDENKSAVVSGKTLSNLQVLDGRFLTQLEDRNSDGVEELLINTSNQVILVDGSSLSNLNQYDITIRYNSPTRFFELESLGQDVNGDGIQDYFSDTKRIISGSDFSIVPGLDDLFSGLFLVSDFNNQGTKNFISHENGPTNSDYSYLSNFEVNFSVEAP